MSKTFTLESALDYLRAHKDGVYQITASKNCDALVAWLIEYLQKPKVDDVTAILYDVVDAVDEAFGTYKANNGKYMNGGEMFREAIESIRPILEPYLSTTKRESAQPDDSIIEKIREKAEGVVKLYQSWSIAEVAFNNPGLSELERKMSARDALAVGCELAYMVKRELHPSTKRESAPPVEKTIYRAEFLWKSEEESVEEAGYEFVNASTEEYRKAMWDVLLQRATKRESSRDKLYDIVGGCLTGHKMLYHLIDEGATESVDLLDVVTPHPDTSTKRGHEELEHLRDEIVNALTKIESESQ